MDEGPANHSGSDGSPRVQLLHGATMPQIGLGTASMTGEDAERTVATAVELGYRLFDTAYAYGNEEAVGKALRACGVSREDVFVTTKLNGEWHGYDEAQEALAASAQRLGLDYVDLYLIHWPLAARGRNVLAWMGLARLLEDGLVRAIGTANFKPAHLERLIQETGVVPDVNQVQLNPLVTRSGIREFDATHRIVTQSWSPLGLGTHRMLAGRTTFEEPVASGARAAVRDLLREPLIVECAERYGKTPAQVLLRWHVELGLSAVPHSANPAHLAANLDVFDFCLTDEEVAAISAFDGGEQAAVDSDRTGH